MADVFSTKTKVSFGWLSLSVLLALVFCVPTEAQTKPLVLISQPDSTRAIALESVTFTREPFPPDSFIPWSQDRRTRILVFALNLQLQPDEGPSSVAADAEDGSQRHYDLTVEAVRSIPGQQWLTVLTLRLNDNIGDVGDVLVRIAYNSRSSNRVRLAMGHVGGGLADDPGSEPTPAPPYLISGQVTVNGVRLPNIRVTLTGAASGTATTDAQGRYSILAAEAGNYVVSVAHPLYDFTQRALIDLSGNRDHIDFQGTTDITLRGRIHDGLGRGIGGVRMDWTGAQSGTTSTGVDGTYSFVVSAYGGYTVRPSKEQNYYSYAPGVGNVTTSGNRVADFTATLNASVSPSYVLEFDGTPKTVDFSIPHYPPDWNLFWLDGLDFGHFFWEFWAMPGDNAAATYMISDGWGGAHAILFGVANLGGAEPGRYQLLGDIWNGTSLTYFASDQGPAPNEWGHYAAGWDGSNIIVYYNGVPVGKTEFTGPRITPGGIQGCGRLLIGGSDHANFVGRIAQVRGYETYNPRENAHTVYASTAPETVFSVDGSLLSYFFRPAEEIADLSLYGQYGKQHPGLLHSTSNGVPYACNGCPLPQFVIDPTAPDFAHPENPGRTVAPVENPAAPPNGALVFDSFSRPNSTYSLGELGGLSATEGGSLGPQNWLSGFTSGSPQPFGILNGKAVILANSAAVTWVSMPAPHVGLDIRVDRHAGRWGSGQNTAIGFRISDARNYFFAYSSEGVEQSLPKTLTVGYYSNGLRTDLTAGLVLPAVWTTMRVVTTSAGVVSVFADGTLVYTTTISYLSSSTGAGLYSNGPGLGLTNRWDNFSIFEAPYSS